MKRSRVRPSVCLSVCLFHRWTAGAACGAFAAQRPAGRRRRSTAAGAGVQRAATAPQHGAQQQMRAALC